MEMTGEQLKFLREQRGMTREDLAAFLGDSSASTVNKWERNIHPVPQWVADKMFSKLPISFTVEELSEMYELCREEAFSMGELIQEAVRMRLEQRRAAKTPGKQNITYLAQHEQSSKVAEDPPKPPRKNGTED